MSARQGFWSRPWGFPQATLLCSALLLNGWAIQMVAGGTGLSPLSFPANGLVLASLWAVTALVSWRWGETWFVRWLAGVPMAVASLAHLGILALISGIIPQGTPGWTTNIVSSWSFALMLLVVLANLGLTTMRRLFRFRNWRDAGFLANHLGTWVVLAGMAMGAGDLLKVRVVAAEGQPTNSGTTQDGTPGGRLAQLPFSITLKKFTLEEYPPKLNYFAVNASGPEKPSRTPAHATVGSRFIFKDLEVEILEMLPHSVLRNEAYVAAENPNGVAAWRVRVHPLTAELTPREGWISPGKGAISARALHTETGIVALVDPEARLFRSEVELQDHLKKPLGVAKIEVNQPLSLAGWKVYQASYEPDPATGEVRVSILEAVFDPWLPVIYGGATLMLAGAAFLFFSGLKLRVKESA